VDPVKNHQGDRTMDETEAAEFGQYIYTSRCPIEAHAPQVPTTADMPNPTQQAEDDTAIKKLKNRKAMSLDRLCAELLKSGPVALSMIIADVINKVMANGEDLELGVGILTTLQKPGKPAEPVKNIRPIVLLPLFRL
jgi:hypothetical protein